MKVLILGCGWVGQIFAKKCIGRGDEVYATTTSPEKLQALKAIGVTPCLMDFGSPLNTEDTILHDLHIELVLISVPAKRKEEYGACMDKFERLASFMKGIRYKTAVYLSSVGVYPATGQVICESDIPVAQLDKKLYHAERLLTEQISGLNILRLGGIFGYNRIPGKHFGKKICTVANQKANYIHADDICGIIMKIYSTKTVDQLFNAVSPAHPEKKEVILAMVAKYQIDPPSSFENTDGLTKLVSSKKLTDMLAYHFLYPDPVSY